VGRMTSEQLEAFLAFGTASVAVAEVTELAARMQPTDRTSLALLVELELLHTQLRALFAEGHDDTVCTVAENLVVLGKRTTDALVQVTNRSGD
jgi:hypothetical protein